MKASEILARRRALLARVETEGAEAAYAAALAVCQDTKAPAPARATCSATLFRVGGFFNVREDRAPKEPHEMTVAELDARLLELRHPDGQDPSLDTDGADVID